jgi:hypothetical protein
MSLHFCARVAVRLFRRRHFLRVTIVMEMVTVEQVLVEMA